MWFGTILLIYSCTFVAMNAKIKSEAKAGFFVFVAILSIIIWLLSWLMG